VITNGRPLLCLSERDAHDAERNTTMTKKRTPATSKPGTTTLRVSDLSQIRGGTDYYIKKHVANVR